jgi:DNA helicase-2/ATP-dependent DNA helicase PcrA
VTDILEGLNPAQREAVTAPDGPVLVLAGPGSGKTRVLTHRAAWLIQDRGIAPAHIMAVTFTNKAAREMRRRVEDLLGGELHGLTVGTFHATCARILRREAGLMPLSHDYHIFDTADQAELVKQAITDLNLDPKRYPPPRILGTISRAKNELITPELYRAESYFGEVVGRVYAYYMALLEINDAMDFDDLLMRTALLFQEHPNALARYQQAYEHILVDEFQDTNVAQYVLVRQLVEVHQCLFCVGDEDQSIYRWRGADYRNVLRFREDYPDARVILLEQNYRSTQTILDAAQGIIDQNPHRTPKHLFTENPEGPEITIREAYDEREEAKLVVDTIATTLVASEGIEPGECAIMYRTNAQSRALEEAFTRASLPYRLVGATRFYSRREIKDVVAYLRIVHNPEDTVSLLRVINTPPRGIGSKTLDTLRAWAAQRGSSIYEAVDALVQHPDEGPFSGRARNALRDFGLMLNGWREASAEMSAAALLQRILEQTQYYNYIYDGTDQGQERWENVSELLNLTHDYEDVPLETLLTDIALVSDIDNYTEDVNAPTLLTLHAAKGLEFDAVFIIGAQDGTLPHSRSFDDPEAMAEERRLMYVGLTRARCRVYVSYTFRSTGWGGQDLNIPSRFLDDIPMRLLAGGFAARRSASKTLYTWEPEAEPQRGQLTEPHFQPGTRVRHPKFGEGTVMESHPAGGDEEVRIEFDEIGLKRLLVGFAKLDVLSEPEN